MTELEILAELKTAYNFMEDIEENADTTQVNEFEKMELLKIQHTMSSIYSRVYKTIEKENKESLYYEKDIMVADTIYNDYLAISEDYDDQYLCYQDINKKTKWWEDYRFLTK